MRRRLDPRWTFINPLSVGSYALVGAGSGDAHLSLSVPAGTAHNAYHVNEGVRVMQSAENVDFELEVKFNTEPDDGYNDQGIIIEQDAGNWLRFDVYDASDTVAGDTLYVGNTVGGTTVAVPFGGAGISDGAAMYLRVARSGDLWTFTYSGGGSVWTTATTLIQALTVTAVGVYAGNPVEALPFTSEVDYFFNTANPIDPEDPI